MTINNYPANVPSSVRGVFDSYVPFGSDLVYYCVSNAYNTTAEYDAIFRPVGSDQLKLVRAVRQTDGTYEFSISDRSGDLQGVVVAHPEYAVSNIAGAGQYYDPPSGSGLVVVCVVVLASLSILRTVFGGIRWVRSKRYRV